jgi:hypothetical protein
MRTTVDIPDTLYRRLKAQAAREGCSVKALVLRGVASELREGPGPKRRRKRVKLPLIRSKAPGTLLLDNAKIYELIDFP